MKEIKSKVESGEYESSKYISDISACSMETLLDEANK